MNSALRPEAPAHRIAAAVRAREVSCVEVVEAALARIDRLDPRINAFTAVARERACSRASTLDAALRAGASAAPLAGVPFAVKAMIDVAGVVTTAGSSLHVHDAPAARDAEVVQRLEQAGAICLGALNMDEFGMGGTTEHSHFGPTRNPHDLARTPGGSSGGSAAALAAGMVPLALGGDALGSIRLPASLCGVYGLRPTRGSVPDAGVLGAGGSISTIGPLAREVRDVALSHALLTARPSRAPDPAQARALRLARAGGYFAEGLDEDADAALSDVALALQTRDVVEFPEAARARAAAILINASESALGQLPALRERVGQFQPGTRDRYLAHALLPVHWYLHAQRFRAWHRQRLRELFRQVDVIVLPATPCAAPAIGQATLRIRGVEQPTGPMLGWFTQPLAGTDCPALTVPIARPGRLPIGVQLLAPPSCEDWLFDVAAALESAGIARATLAPIA